MMAFIRPRLRKPLGIALAGTVLAAAWALRSGHAWQLSVAMEVTVLVSAITAYVRAGEDNDEGALTGSRADERQKLLSLRSRALGWNFAMAAAFTGLTVAVAAKATWGWPFLVILAVTGFAYLLGLSNYGVAEEGTADDADTGPRCGPRPADDLLPPLTQPGSAPTRCLTAPHLIVAPSPAPMPMRAIFTSAPGCRPGTHTAKPAATPDGRCTWRLSGCVPTAALGLAHSDAPTPAADPSTTRRPSSSAACSHAK